MNRTRMLILGCVALIVSVGMTVVVYRMLKDRMSPPEDTVQIVLANQNVSLGTRLTESDVRLAPWPRAVKMEGTFHSISEVVNRGVIVPMTPNEPVLETKLAPKEGGAGIAAAIPDGMRAVAVKVNDVIGVAGFVVPGTRVDVILSGSPGGGDDREMAKVILENVQVLAAGQNVDRDSEGKPLNVQVVTLLVNPEQSQKLALASMDGKIQLALRNPLDLDFANPTAISKDGLYGQSVSLPTPPPPAPVRRPAAAAPPQPPAPQPKVEAPAPAKPEPFELQLIQGTKKETILFEKSN